MSEKLTSKYWTDRYIHQDTGWDIASISSPLKAYFDQLTDKSLKILIPGCGFAYEGEYLWSKGFKNVFLLDFSAEPLKEFGKRVPDFPKDQIFIADFFTHEGNYDLIIEQTLFCALDPSLRPAYAEKSASLLKNGGKLVGLLFNREFESGPPFGGNKQEYMQYFSPHFSAISMENCYNSIPARQNSELFIKLIK